MTVELKLCAVDGRELASSQGRLAAEGHLATAQAALVRDGHRARFLNQFEWSEDIDLSNFQGLLRARSTGRCAATVIQTRPNQFATMPVVRLE